MNLQLGGAGKSGMVISVGSSVQLTQRRRPFDTLASFWTDDLLFCIDYTDESTLITIPHFPARLAEGSKFHLQKRFIIIFYQLQVFLKQSWGNLNIQN